MKKILNPVKKFKILIKNSNFSQDFLNPCKKFKKKFKKIQKKFKKFKEKFKKSKFFVTKIHKF